MTSPEAFEDELRARDLALPGPHLRNRVMCAAKGEASRQRDLRQLRWLFASVVLLMAFGTVSQRMLDRSIEQAIGITDIASVQGDGPHYCSALSMMSALHADATHVPEDILRLLQPSIIPRARRRPRARPKREQSRSSKGASTYV